VTNFKSKLRELYNDFDSKLMKKEEDHKQKKARAEEAKQQTVKIAKDFVLPVLEEAEKEILEKGHACKISVMDSHKKITFELDPSSKGRIYNRTFLPRLDFAISIGANHKYIIIGSNLDQFGKPEVDLAKDSRNTVEKHVLEFLNQVFDPFNFKIV
jgi:hypothetical protein